MTAHRNATMGLALTVVLGAAFVTPPDVGAQPPAQAAAAGKEKKKPNQVPDKGKDDPEGQPTAADAALERMLSRPVESLKVKQHPNGMVSVDLGGTFMEVATASAGASGEVTFACTNDAMHAQMVLHAQALLPSRPLALVPIVNAADRRDTAEAWPEKE